MWNRQEEQRLRQNYRRRGGVAAGTGRRRNSAAAAGMGWRYNKAAPTYVTSIVSYFHCMLLEMAPAFHSGSTFTLDSLQDLLLRASELDTSRKTIPIVSHHSQCIRQNFCNCQDDQTITIMEDKFTSCIKPRNTTTELSP